MHSVGSKFLCGHGADPYCRHVHMELTPTSVSMRPPEPEPPLRVGVISGWRLTFSQLRRRLFCYWLYYYDYFVTLWLILRSCMCAWAAWRRWDSALCSRTSAASFVVGAQFWTVGTGIDKGTENENKSSKASLFQYNVFRILKVILSSLDENLNVVEITAIHCYKLKKLIKDMREI